MIYTEDIEDGVGRSVETLFHDYGIEVTEPHNDEVAVLISDGLFATYDIPRDLHSIIEDITYIIREEIYR